MRKAIGTRSKAETIEAQAAAAAYVKSMRALQGDPIQLMHTVALFNGAFQREMLTSAQLAQVLQVLFFSDQAQIIENQLAALDEGEGDIRFYKFADLDKNDRKMPFTATIRRLQNGEFETTILTNYTLPDGTKIPVENRQQRDLATYKVIKEAPAIILGPHTTNVARVRLRQELCETNTLQPTEWSEYARGLYAGAQREAELGQLCAQKSKNVAALHLGSPFLRKINKGPRKGTCTVNVYYYDELAVHGSLNKITLPISDPKQQVFSPQESAEIELGIKNNVIPPIIANIVDGILHGLKAIHAAHVIHQDIKAANILLDRDEHGTLYAKIADFGLAVSMDDPDDMDTWPLASGYMASPEMNWLHTNPDHKSPQMAYYVEKSEYDLGYAVYDRDRVKIDNMMENMYTTSYLPPTCAGDMWALGITLFTMLTGRFPTINDYDDGMIDSNPLIKGLLEVDPSKRFTIDQAIAVWQDNLGKMPFPSPMPLANKIGSVSTSSPIASGDIEAMVATLNTTSQVSSLSSVGSPRHATPKTLARQAAALGRFRAYSDEDPPKTPPLATRRSSKSAGF